MRNIVFINDCHLSADKPVGRLDDIRETGRKKFEFVLQWAYENEAVISIAGDLSHKPRSWGVLRDLSWSITEDDVILAVYGQHDTYMYSEETRDETTLGVLGIENKIHILKSKGYSGIEGCRFFGVHYGQEIPDPGIEEGKINILVIHAPIAEKAQWITQDYMDAEKFLKEHSEFDIIHCGDIHQKFAIKVKSERWIVNSGPMIRREATPYNYQHKPGFWVYNLKNKGMSWVEIPHKPAEEVLSRDHIELEEMANDVLKEFIESIKTDSVNSSASIVSNIWQIIKNNSIDDEVVQIISKTVGEGRMKDGK